MAANTPSGKLLNLLSDVLKNHALAYQLEENVSKTLEKYDLDEANGVRSLILTFF